jgi:cobalamin biosynthesis protein CobT
MSKPAWKCVKNCVNVNDNLEAPEDEQVGLEVREELHGREWEPANGDDDNDLEAHKDEQL